MLTNPAIGEGVLSPNEPQPNWHFYSIACKVQVDVFLPTPNWKCIDPRTIEAVHQMGQRSASRHFSR